MLLIFDLDDTLVDTSGCLVPLKLKEALQAMIIAGLEVPSFKKAFTLLKRIDQQSPSGRETLQRFLKKIGAEERFLEIGLREYYGHIEGDYSITMLEKAAEVLQQVQGEHTLALVTEGLEHQQYEKMRKAGIDTEMFQRIIVSSNANKKPHYRAIIQELGNGSSVVVCGDRFNTDLVPAKELGCITVHMQWGRGTKCNEYGKNRPDYCITRLQELPGIIREVACKP